MLAIGGRVWGPCPPNQESLSQPEGVLQGPRGTQACPTMQQADAGTATAEGQRPSLDPTAGRAPLETSLEPCW